MSEISKELILILLKTFIAFFLHAELKYISCYVRSTKHQQQQRAGRALNEQMLETSIDKNVDTQQKYKTYRPSVTYEYEVQFKI